MKRWWVTDCGPRPLPFPAGVQNRPDQCHEAARLPPRLPRGLLPAGRHLETGVGEGSPGASESRHHPRAVSQVVLAVPKVCLRKKNIWYSILITKWFSELTGCVFCVQNHCGEVKGSSLHPPKEIHPVLKSRLNRTRLRQHQRTGWGYVSLWSGWHGPILAACCQQRARPHG